MKRLALVLLLVACGGKPATDPVDPASPSPEGDDVAGAGCITGGCSGTLCVAAGSEQMMTTCEMKPEYACYQGAECAVQASGECGWTMDERLEQCLASPPPL